jgi:superfamily I DNA/RNA helicase
MGEHGVKPWNILALAFNEKAAEELKNRVIGMVGNVEDLSKSSFNYCSNF